MTGQGDDLLGVIAIVGARCWRGVGRSRCVFGRRGLYTRISSLGHSDGGGVSTNGGVGSGIPTDLGFNVRLLVLDWRGQEEGTALDA
jgi:hypothetical protein